MAARLLLILAAALLSCNEEDRTCIQWDPVMTTQEIYLGNGYWNIMPISVLRCVKWQAGHDAGPEN